MNKTKSDVAIAAYKKQRNYVVALKQKSKCNYFNNLDVRKGVKPFWETCKSYFSNKHSRGDTSIILIERNELILNNRKIVTTFNDYFSEIVPSLNLFKWPGNVKSLASNRDIIDHPSIKMIKNKFTKIAKFSFHQVTLVDVRKAIKDIRLDKFSSEDIPADILRRCDLCFQALTNCINQSIVSGKFPDLLKLASISPIYNAKDPLD